MRQIPHVRLRQDLLSEVRADKPVIFLEHSPADLEQIKGLPIDLHLSGIRMAGRYFL